MQIHTQVRAIGKMVAATIVGLLLIQGASLQYSLSAPRTGIPGFPHLKWGMSLDQFVQVMRRQNYQSFSVNDSKTSNGDGTWIGAFLENKFVLEGYIMDEAMFRFDDTTKLFVAYSANHETKLWMDYDKIAMKFEKKYKTVPLPKNPHYRKGLHTKNTLWKGTLHLRNEALHFVFEAPTFVISFVKFDFRPNDLGLTFRVRQKK